MTSDNGGKSKGVIKEFLGGIIGFSLFTAICNPKSPVNNKLPEEKIKNLEISPNIEVFSKNKTYHIHHWIIFLILYLPLLTVKKNFLKSKLFRGFLLGNIIQGLMYKDRFKIIEKPKKEIDKHSNVE